MRQHFLCALIAISGAMAATPALAAENAQSSFSVSLEVPAVCDLDASAVSVVPGADLVTANVAEFCNTSRGFEVVATHRPLDAGEHVEVDYGTQIASLDQSGVSMIAFRSGQRLDTVPVAIRPTHLDQQLVLNFGLTAL